MLSRVESRDVMDNKNQNQESKPNLQLQSIWRKLLGRFEEPTLKEVGYFSTSICGSSVVGSRPFGFYGTHKKMLGQVGVLAKADSEKLWRVCNLY